MWGRNSRWGVRRGGALLTLTDGAAFAELLDVVERGTAFFAGAFRAAAFSGGGDGGFPCTHWLRGRSHRSQ
jgi:hypothetical protein